MSINRGRPITKVLVGQTSSRLEYLHIEQSDNADRVVCNDARAFQLGWWSLQRRRIAVYRQLDDSAARPELVLRFCRFVDPNLSCSRCIWSVSSAFFSVSLFRASTSLLLQSLQLSREVFLVFMD